MKKYDLEEFKFPELVLRFSIEYSITLPKSTEIFEELKKWLFLAANSSKQKNTDKLPHVAMRTEQIIMDEMWHMFLQYTAAYEAFCFSSFGFIVHHLPENTSRKNLLTSLELKENLTSYLSFVESQFGLATVRKWFVEFADIYPPEEVILLKIRALEAQKKYWMAESAQGK